MIKIEITESPDQLLLGEMTLYFDEFLIGSSKKNDLILLDPGVNPKHLKLYVRADDQSLFAESSKDRPFYHLNSKKTKGMRKLKEGDEITVGETRFKITAFEASESPSEEFLEKYSRAIKDDPDIESILKNLEEEILIIEKERVRSKKDGI